MDKMKRNSIRTDFVWQEQEGKQEQFKDIQALINSSTFNARNFCFQIQGLSRSCMNLDCELSLVSAGLNFGACERKGGTADNTSRNKISVAHTTQKYVVIML